jgi:hypothetical protein
MYLDGKLYEWTAINLTLCFLPVVGAAADALYLDGQTADGVSSMPQTLRAVIVPYCAYVLRGMKNFT